MDRSWIALLALALATPAPAQEEPAAEEPPAEEAPAEEAPAEEAASDEAASEEGDAGSWKFYVGADLVDTTVSRSAPPSAPIADADSSMLRLRAGARILEAVNFELHYGLDQADEDQGEVATDAYYGAFFVPTAKLFDWAELAFPVGYARSEFDGGDALGSIAYGADLEIALKGFWDALPDIRLTAGAMVYYQKSDGRVYGLNSGLRYDF